MNKNTMQKNSVIFIMAAISCFLWGSAFPCIKVGYEMFGIDSSDTATQILFAGVRFTLAGILTIAMGSAASRKFLRPNKESAPKILLISFFQTILQYIFFYIGLSKTTGVNASIVEASGTFFAILISSLIFKMERLSLCKVLGCVLGFAGVVLVKAGGKMSVNALGDTFVLFSTISYALSSVCTKRFSDKINPVCISGYQFLFGGMVMTVGALAFGGRLAPLNFQRTAMLLYLALVSAVAYSLWGILLKFNRVSRVTVYGFLNPLFGVLLSAVMLHEGYSFGLNHAAALIMVCAGIYIVNSKFAETK